MALFEISDKKITRLNQTTLAAHGLRERADLQRHVREAIEIISEDLLVVSEEFANWEDSRRRIDLLCVDKSANLVVVELKRAEDVFMDLQAMRYAAMISVMTFGEVVSAFTDYLARLGRSESAEQVILTFLGWDTPLEDRFAQAVHIILVAAEFPKELTSSVLWLNESGLNIKCVKLQPYEIAGQVILDIQQIIPLPEAAAYQIQLRKKLAEEKQVSSGASDWTRFDLYLDGRQEKALYKRWLIFYAACELVSKGVSPDEITSVLGSGTWLQFEGTLNLEEFKAKALSSGVSEEKLRRFICADEHLIHFKGNTYALSNQWSKYNLPSLDVLLAKYPQLNIRYVAADPVASSSAGI
jgi:hypothetical protein